MAQPQQGSEVYDHLYKIILVGDATVGKTHLLSRYTRGTLPKTPKATIGVEFATRTVPLAVGGTVKAQIWDTAGQERYRSITSAHYRRAVGALLVYDVTRKKSFLNASKWLEELRQNAEPDIVVMMVGNKVDLCEKDPSLREVPYEVAARFAQSNGLFFSEASAVTSLNVKLVFEHLLQEIYNQRAEGHTVQVEASVAPLVDGGRISTRKYSNNEGDETSTGVPALEVYEGLSRKTVGIRDLVRIRYQGKAKLVYLKEVTGNEGPDSEAAARRIDSARHLAGIPRAPGGAATLIGAQQRPVPSSRLPVTHRYPGVSGSVQKAEQEQLQRHPYNKEGGASAVREVTASSGGAAIAASCGFQLPAAGPIADRGEWRETHPLSPVLLGRGALKGGPSCFSHAASRAAPPQSSSSGECEGVDCI
ncbi:Ras family domain-containing protein [Cyclospora cayetanensis]|uniref:Ras family domain-containing protein n=1 Tax=Cyclospora cayetanensis TaxID=88456 RepID=A0A1D3D3J2_9EIME|nr:Ras family domain-containing protein [Cyclospora cayetanensis]